MMRKLSLSARKARRRYLSTSMGDLYIGQMKCEITRVRFAEACMIIEAMCGPAQKGDMAGMARIYGTDGRLVIPGTKEHHYGVKTRGTTWYITFRMNIAHTSVPPGADDTLSGLS